MVEKQIEILLLKTSTNELDCGWSRKLKFTNRKEFVMNTNTFNSRRRSPVNAEETVISVATVVDLFYVKQIIDRAYEDHIPRLSLVVTFYDYREVPGIIDEYTVDRLIDLAQHQGYRLVVQERLGNNHRGRTTRYGFEAVPGMYPCWALEPKEDEE